MFVAKKVKVTENINNVLQSVENTVGKKRKCWLPAFSTFPSVFKSQCCAISGYNKFFMMSNNIS